MTTVSTIQPQHWDSILEIQNLCYPQLPPEELEVLQSKWQASPQSCYVMLNDEEQVVGYLLSHYWQTEKVPKLNEQVDYSAKSNRLFLHDLAVDPRAQSTGAGKALFNHLLELASQMAVKQILLISMPNAIGFWQQLGFKDVPELEPCVSYGPGAMTMKLML